MVSTSSDAPAHRPHLRQTEIQADRSTKRQCQKLDVELRPVQGIEHGQICGISQQPDPSICHTEHMIEAQLLGVVSLLLPQCQTRHYCPCCAFLAERILPMDPLRAYEE